MIYVAIALWIVALGSLSNVWQTRRVAGALLDFVDQLVNIENARSDIQPGTDPQLIERIEAAERRVEAIAADATKQYRKIAQERRRIESASGSDDDDEPDTPAALDQLRLAVGQPAPPNGRPRLRRPSRSRR